MTAADTQSKRSADTRLREAEKLGVVGGSGQQGSHHTYLSERGLPRMPQSAVWTAVTPNVTAPGFEEADCFLTVFGKVAATPKSTTETSFAAPPVVSLLGPRKSLKCA
jgi:hypothetical protein